MYSMKKKQAAQKRPALHGVGGVHARSSTSGDVQKRRAGRFVSHSSLMPRNFTCGSSKLAVEEACFLHWLRENGGHGKRTGQNWMHNDARLIAIGYVKAWEDRSKDTVHYSLAQSGAKALLQYKSANPQMILSRRDASV